MKKYNIVVLTDHLTHTAHDSIFPLFKDMASNLSCNSMYIASRGQKENINFFQGEVNESITGKPLDGEFTYKNKDNWYESSKEIKLSNFDVLFLRIDYPISKKFLKNIKNIFNGLIINEPNGTLKTGSKEYLLNFKKITPSLFLATKPDDISYYSNIMDVVIKPLRNYGGNGLIRLGRSNYIEGLETTYDIAFKEAEKLLLKEGKLLISEFLYNVSKGDKRVIVVNGTILGAMLRIPEKNNWLCNLNQGGKYITSDITLDEYKIAEITSKRLLKEGVVLYGFDTLVNNEGKRVLTELNTANVGGFKQIQELTKSNIIKDASSRLFDYINSNA